jgi:hypothetical protein
MAAPARTATPSKTIVPARAGLVAEFLIFAWAAAVSALYELPPLPEPPLLLPPLPEELLDEPPPLLDDEPPLLLLDDEPLLLLDEELS